jgi:hypothetical protein
MTDKQQFWIADAEGAKAVVTGPDARDEWVKVRAGPRRPSRSTATSSTSATSTMAASAA